MEKIEDLNKKINRLFRQLGRDVYLNSKAKSLNPNAYKKTLKKIDKNILAIEALEGIQQKDEDAFKIILQPEKSEDGLGMYFFCKKCRVGNNPVSTHCIKCGTQLNS